MNKPITSLFSLFLLVSTSVVYGEETYRMSQLVERDGFYYKKFSDDVFTGTVKSKYDQGRIQNGLKVDYWVRYHKNGQLRDKGSWIEGWKDGEWVHYSISTLEEANKALAECVNGALEEMERLQKVNKEIARAAEVMAQISKTLE